MYRLNTTNNVTFFHFITLKSSDFSRSGVSIVIFSRKAFHELKRNTDYIAARPGNERNQRYDRQRGGIENPPCVLREPLSRKDPWTGNTGFSQRIWAAEGGDRGRWRGWQITTGEW